MQARVWTGTHGTHCALWMLTKVALAGRAPVGEGVPQSLFESCGPSFGTHTNGAKFTMFAMLQLFTCHQIAAVQGRRQ